MEKEAITLLQTLIFQAAHVTLVRASPKFATPGPFRRLIGPIGRETSPELGSAELSASTQADARATWSFTRRLTKSSRLRVLRARGAGELGPGCYVIKLARRADDALARSLLTREARVASDASHPNLSTVLAANFDEERAQIVLPYYEGVTLERLAVLWRRAPARVAQVLAIVRQVASACGVLHAAGWLHGHVAKRHVVVSPLGQATLLDMAGTRRLDSQECEACWPGPLAPVLCPDGRERGLRLTAAADVYAVGLLMFELLTGQPVFTANSAKELERLHRRARPPEVRSLCAEVSREVNELVRRMLAKDPLRRPTSDEVVQWLMEVEIADLARTQ